MLTPYRELLEDTISRINTAFDGTNYIESQKEYAGIALRYPFASCLFQMRQKGITAHTAFSQLNEKAQHGILTEYLR